VALQRFKKAAPGIDDANPNCAGCWKEIGRYPHLSASKTVCLGMGKGIFQ
jgi:hypothetical protein